jgi:hypothetical protein
MLMTKREPARVGETKSSVMPCSPNGVSEIGPAISKLGEKPL